MDKAELITTFMKNDPLMKLVEHFKEIIDWYIIIDTKESFLIYLYGGTKEKI